MKTLQNISFAIALVSLVACGGNTANKDNAEKDNKTNTEQAAPETKAAPEETATKVDTVELHLAAKGENMTEISFEPKTLEVPAGSHVKLIFHNESSAAGMLHDFVLIPNGIGQEIATAAIQAGAANNFEPTDPRIIAQTKMAQMGETETIEFEAPAAGEYEYICTYPGHFPAMKGTFTVK